MSDKTIALPGEAKVQKSPVPAGNRGLHFNNLAEMWRFCEGVVNSHKFKDIDTPEVALVMLQAGLELGLTPIWSITNIMVINGRPSVWGDALLGLVQGHPDCIDVIETMNADRTEATCEVQRKGRLPVKRTFSLEDAKRAYLLGKDGPWKLYPQRMLQMRARSWACRDSFADVLRGLGVVEEQRDNIKPAEAREVTPTPALVLPDEVDGSQQVKPIDGEFNVVPEKKKRHRRTKAEMEAARAKEVNQPEPKGPDEEPAELTALQTLRKLIELSPVDEPSFLRHLIVDMELEPSQTLDDLPEHKTERLVKEFMVIASEIVDK